MVGSPAECTTTSTWPMKRPHSGSALRLIALHQGRRTQSTQLALWILAEILCSQLGLDSIRGDRLAQVTHVGLALGSPLLPESCRSCSRPSRCTCVGLRWKSKAQPRRPACQKKMTPRTSTTAIAPLAKAVRGSSAKHARYYWLLLAESYLRRRLFGALLRPIEAVPWPAG